MPTLRGVPLLRAGCLVPFVRSLERAGAPVGRHLASGELAYYPYDHSERPISLLGALKFTHRTAVKEGAEDLGCRVVTDNALTEIGHFGRAALRAPTVRAGLQASFAQMKYFSTHERFALLEQAGTAQIVSSYPRGIDRSLLYIVEQFNAMLIQAYCRSSGFRGPVFRRIAFSSRPLGSLDRLRGWLCDDLAMTDRSYMTMTLADGVLDRPNPNRLGAAQDQGDADGWDLMGPGLSVSQTVRRLVETMMLDRFPAFEDVARVSGMSRRTLQRRLGEEGTSYGDLLDDLRRDRALCEVLDGSRSLIAISAGLGYSCQSHFTRAFRRWTAQTPRQYRQGAARAASA